MVHYCDWTEPPILAFFHTSYVGDWRTLHIPDSSCEVWDIRVQAALWSIRNERNLRIFQDQSNSAEGRNAILFQSLEAISHVTLFAALFCCLIFQFFFSSSRLV